MVGFLKYCLYFQFVILLSFNSISYGKVNSNNLIEITDVHQILLIGNQVYYLEDKTGDLGIEDILDEQYQQYFIHHSEDVFSRPATKSAFWFKFTVKNLTNEAIWFEVGSTYAWYIDYYFPNDTLGGYDSIITGTMRPESTKPIKTNVFWLPLADAGDTVPRTCFVRIQSGLTYETPLAIGTIRSLSQHKDIYDYLTAGFVGLLLIMFLYNLFIYLSIKDHLYLFYLAYILMMLVSMPYANNYPFIEKINFWFIDKYWWNENFLLWHSVGYLFIGLFCIKYLDLKKNSRYLRWLIIGESIVLAVVFPFLTIVGFQFVELVNAIQLFILLFYLTCLISGYLMLYKRVSQGLYFVLGWTFLVISVFVFFAVINGKLLFAPFTRNALYFGCAMEVWMFSLALGNRLNLLQKEKEQVQLENMRLVNEQNVLLEEKVLKRTNELELQNNRLAQSNESLRNTTQKLDNQSKLLSELNVTKDRLFAIISHDLKSPLVTLTHLIELADDQLLNPEDYAKISSKLKKDVQALHLTLNNLLHWSLMQMKGLSTNKDSILLHELIEENISLLNEFANGKQIEVENKTLKSQMVYADPDLLRLVFRNLINNAIKFSKPGGKVVIEAIRKNNEKIISISDNGIGMTADVVGKLLKKQSVKSMFGTEGEKGTGLGLMLCQDFVEKNGGKIWVESEEDRGTTFYFTLPVTE